MEIQTVETSKLRPHPQNPRTHPDSAIDKLVKSLTEFGWTNPILVSKDNYVLAGHARLKAAERAGLSAVPVIQLPLSGSKALAYMIADNRLQEETDWDIPKLVDLFQGLDTGEIDLEITGFDLDEIEALIVPPNEGLTDDDEVPEPKKAICKAGDLWTLGNHRLLCGDATVEAHVAKLMGGEKADMVFTDPPYGVDYDGTHLSPGTYFGEGKRKAEKLMGDTGDMFGEAMPHIASILKADKCCVYLCFGGALGYPVYKAVYDNDLIPRALIIWNKNHAQFGSMGSQYKQKHEPILYLYRKGKSTQWFGANNEVTVWDIDRQVKSEYHLTQKPVALSERAIGNSSKIGDILADLFGGSGSTLIACEKLGRKCYMMEIDEHYCDVIIERWQNFTGKKACLLPESSMKT